MKNRLYSEEEISLLIKRAVELEAERSVSREKSSRKGLSITELEQIAAESGIDPELIQIAAKELDSSTTTEETFNSEKAKVKSEEIVSERWLSVGLEPRNFDDMITELNHKYGTSDKDVNWWDDLWNSYHGKAKVRKSSNSLEWQYTDEFGYYTTRVLLQKRGENFRVRVSKRQLWGMKWNTGDYDFLYPAIFFPVIIALGGVLSFSLLGNVWPGIAVGAIASALLYPVIKYFRKRTLDKHTEEVTETADVLHKLAIQLLYDSNQSDNKKSDAQIVNEDFETINITDEESENSFGKLRNNLRE